MPRSPSPPQFSLIAVRADAFFIVVRALGQELIPMIGPVGLEYWPESSEKVSSAGGELSSWHARTGRSSAKDANLFRNRAIIGGVRAPCRLCFTVKGPDALCAPAIGADHCGCRQPARPGRCPPAQPAQARTVRGGRTRGHRRRRHSPAL